MTQQRCVTQQVAAFAVSAVACEATSFDFADGIDVVDVIYNPPPKTIVAVVSGKLAVTTRLCVTLGCTTLAVVVIWIDSFCFRAGW